jgi:hypothetical protein
LNKTFFRWLYNEYEKQDENIIRMDLWKNPPFITLLKNKKTMANSYLHSAMKHIMHTSSKSLLNIIYDKQIFI